jgi:hypothetical protein
MPTSFGGLKDKMRLPSITLASLLLSACIQPDDKPSYPIVARILSSISGDYRLTDVTIATLSNVDQMVGTVGSIKGQAALNVDADIEEIMSSTDPDAVYSDRGHIIETDYIVQGGVVIPQNFQTMEMLGLYSVYERTVRFWQTNFDIPFESIGFPMIYYNPRLTRSKNGETIEISTTMNAAYLPGVRDFWFFKTATRERVPVKMNFGVIAHEFGHFVFDYRFAELNRTVYESRLAVNGNFLSGLNEGLADFLSYAVTGSLTEFAASLPELDQERRLPVSWTLRTSTSGVCSGGFYCQGSVLASALYEISQLPELNSLIIAQRVYDALPIFRATWQQQKDSDLINYAAFLNTLLELSPGEKTEFCTIFRKWFDTDNVRLNLACPA